MKTEKPFTASNGYTVTELDDGQICLTKPIPSYKSTLEQKVWMRPDEAAAITEYLYLSLPPAPVPSPVPTEPGIYVSYVKSPNPKIIHKIIDGRWVDADDTHYLSDEQVAKCLPLTRLEPRADTAKAVLDSITNKGIAIFPSAGKASYKLYESDFARVEAEFGVKS